MKPESSSSSPTAPSSLPAASPRSKPRSKPLSARLVALARRIEAAAWNRVGADKTWVLDALAQRARFEREIRSAPPIPHAARR